MTAPDPTRRKRNIIGVIAIVLLIVFYLLEFVGLIDFLTWIILVVAVFVVANIVFSRLKRRALQRDV